jgi:ABC-type Fe3+/spermidine/putrescine transport system ATPase subunit
VLLLDEPLSALDLRLRVQMQRVLKHIQQESGTTFVYVTHDQTEALSMSDRVAIMREGRIEQLGTPREVYERPQTEFVADFVGASNRMTARVIAVHDDGTYDAELEGIGRVRAPGVASLQSGQDARAIVRPEAIAVREASPGRAGLSARIVDLAYLGHHLSCVAESAAGWQLTVSMHQSHAAVAVGDHCSLSWPFDATWLLPAAER